MHILFGNYGNETVALIQWAAQSQLADVSVVSVDTGWAATSWQQRVVQMEAWVQRCGFNVVRLTAPRTFAELVVERGSFPDQKFQWCANFLKGLPLLAWLDEVDPRCEATILLGKRRITSRAYANLLEVIEESEHYNGRRVWHPLYKHTDAERDALIKQTGFEIIKHRSLECDPCVNSNLADLQRLDETELSKVTALEERLQQPFFKPENFADAQTIEHVIKWVHKQPAVDFSHEMFDMGCGAPYGCGL